MSRNWYKIGLCGLVAAGIAGAFAFGKPETIPVPPHNEKVTGGGPYPKDYFQRPVAEDLLLSGTFGELRPDHFHTGIDIKSSTGAVGQSVMAAADGFVDRIKVTPSGYGNVIYLKHPNGYTTLYGHLDRFAPEIQQYVREQQYKRQRFEIELQPADGQIKVKKGQEIGKMGNSGSSSGPHLHFEIRNTATGKVINPLLFNFPVPDKVAPELRDMKVYFLNAQRMVQGSKPLPVVRLKDGTYHLKGGDTIRIGGWQVGFGVKTYDRMNNSRNDNGVYSISLTTDTQLAYKWEMDELDFDENRYLNAHIDYPCRQRFGAWFHRCFVLPGDHLANYTHTETQGAVALYLEKPVKVTLKVMDAYNNTSTLTFWALRGEAIETFPAPPYQYDMAYDTDNRIEREDFSLFMPKGALYESLHFQYETTPDPSFGVYSATYRVHDDQTPAHKYFDISLKPINIPPTLRDKAVIAYCGDGRPDNCGATWKGEMLTTRVRNFGNYCIMIDTTPPAIIPVVFDKDMRRKSTMSFRIRDNFAVGGQANGLSFRGTVDGQWILFVYDRKRDRLTYTFDEHVGPGEHQLRLVVQDDRGNTGVFERPFIR